MDIDLILLFTLFGLSATCAILYVVLQHIDYIKEYGWLMRLGIFFFILFLIDAFSYIR